MHLSVELQYKLETILLIDIGILCESFHALLMITVKSFG